MSPVRATGSFVAESQGFCPNGFYQVDASDLKKAPQNQELWGSFCGAGNKDQNTGYLKTNTFSAPGLLELYLAGYPSRPGLVLEIENLDDGSKLPIEITHVPRETWRLYQVPLPASWRGKPVRLVAQDRAVTGDGWFALTRPEPGKARPTQALLVLKPLVLSFFLMALFFYAGCCFCARLGVRNVVLIGLSGLTAVGLDGYLSFWLWFFSPFAGRWSNLLLPFLAAGFIFQSLRALDAPARQALKELLLPLTLVGLTSLLVASTGFVYGGLEGPFETASMRFTHPLPADNTIPYLVAEGVVNGHVRRPLLADWLSSDRPPLQTGIYLAQRRYFVHELPYTVVSIIVQSFWILSLWLFLKAFRISRGALSLILVVALLNGFIFLNTFYTWPKLIAAAYVLGFAALLLPREFYVLSRDRWPVAALAGAMLCLAMLSHGGSAFGIAGVIITYFVLRRSLDFKLISAMVSCAFLLYLPWMLYQKLSDPPGDRLLKYHLAGVEPIDPRGFGQVALEAYGKLTLRDWTNARIDNLLTVVDHQREYWGDTLALISGLLQSGSHWNATVAKDAAELRAMNFFYLFPCMGPLLSGLVALVAGAVRRANNTEWRTALKLWLSTAATIIFWCVLLFKPGTTIIHSGTYALVLLFIAASILTLWALSSWLALIVGTLTAMFHVVLYIFLMRQSTAGDSLQADSLDYGFVSLAIVSFAGLVLILWHLAQSQPQDPHDLASRSTLSSSTVPMNL